jgi:hypothetical protein
MTKCQTLPPISPDRMNEPWNIGLPAANGSVCEREEIIPRDVCNVRSIRLVTRQKRRKAQSLYESAESHQAMLDLGVAHVSKVPNISLSLNHQTFIDREPKIFQRDFCGK